MVFKYNRYPVFIPTKGRYNKNMTARSFDTIGLGYTLVVEPQEEHRYRKTMPHANIIVTPHQNKGLTETRNFIWDYVENLGVKRFWTFDDNIYHIYRLNRNTKKRVLTNIPIGIMEDFVERYENVPLAGMNYHSFCKQSDRVPPFYLNTRIYSNMLIKTDLKNEDGTKMRNECYYNDDTDLCIRVMKLGYCIIQFNAFLIDKEVTMRHDGGMTNDYVKDGRLKFATELAEKHPHIVSVTEKFGRPHHHVNYKVFKNNKLKFKEGISIPKGINNYGMKLVELC